MRTLERNKQIVWYSNKSKDNPVIDEYGNETGEYILAYSGPKSICLSVSTPTGEISTNPFGNFSDYDKVLLTDSIEMEVSESTVFWVDNLDTEKPHDYEVKKIAKSLNYLAIAVKKVSVSG